MRGAVEHAQGDGEDVEVEAADCHGIDQKCGIGKLVGLVDLSGGCCALSGLGWQRQ